MRSDSYRLLWTMFLDESSPNVSDSTSWSYNHVPPMLSRRSKTTTRWPSFLSSRAATRPAAPAPITATLRRSPELGEMEEEERVGWGNLGEIWNWLAREHMGEDFVKFEDPESI